MINLIALAIPFFFILIGIELLISQKLKRKLYRFNDSITDLSCGVGSEMLALFVKLLVVPLYAFVWFNFQLFEISTHSIWNWLLCYICVDFTYYWIHRNLHERSMMWAAHIVHHSSDEYNLTVALRQSWFQQIFSIPFYLMLAVVGFPLIMYVTCGALNTLYQFWIHTQLIHKLGPLEWIFMTPSHHRVHHGKNPQYINKNYGSTTVIWDRLFGTFEPERDPVYFGVTSPPKSWNPLWANFHCWVQLFGLAKQTKSWADKLKIWFMPPGWLPRDLQDLPQSPRLPLTYKYNSQTSSALNRYILIQFVILVLGATTLIFFDKQLSLYLMTPCVALVYFTLHCFGEMFDSKPLAYHLEHIRLIAAVLLGSYLFWGQANFSLIIFALSLIAMLSMRYFHHSWQSLQLNEAKDT